ncbi:MAG: heme biosynthesis protein HemY [Methylovirgula sp.]
MLRILIFLIILAAAAFGIAWIADRPGDLVLTWQGYRIETSAGVALAGVVLAAVVLAVLWGIVRFFWRLPRQMRHRAAAKRQTKGLAALSRGMIAVGAGDARLARKSAVEAHRHLADEPLTHLLNAQAAQLSGDRAAAVAAFETLAQMPATRLLGLRGLHVEAQRRGDTDAALFYAHEAHKVEPLPWSAKAVLEHRAGESDWEGALAALESHIAAKLIDKETGARQKAVLETAIALDKADRAPDEALRLTRQALSQAPDLVPAAVLAARLWSRKGDIRKAAKVIETSWPRQPHPDLAEAYLDLRPGDSNSDRLAKAQTLARLAPRDPESQMIVARAALAARDYATARKAMAPLIAEDERPSVRACLIMAELEDAEFGDQGQVREWLARSTRAPRDPVWIADGVTSKEWAPVSPVTGRLDAFVWQRPVERLSANPEADLDAAEWERHWALPPRPAPEPAPVIEASAVTLPAPVETEAAVVDAVPVAEPVAETVPEEPAATVAAAEETAPAPRKRGGRSVQKVVFPMSAAPDDPGPDDNSEAAAIRRLGRG